MRLSERGRRFIQSFEGLRLVAYEDGAGVWTIGYGHTGPDVRPGMTITREEAERLFDRDVGRFERGVDAAVVVPITQEQFDALVSFAFNVGLTAFRNSTLLRRLNDGDYAGAAEQFGRWYRAGRQTMQGLVRRRAAERRLFEGETA